jgi:hypothetical protein
MPHLRQGVVEEVVGAAVEARGRDDLVAGGGQVEDRRGLRGLPGGVSERPDAAFEGGDPLLQDVGRRVHDPRVDVAELLQSEEVGGVVRVVEDVGGCLVDRDGAGAGGRIHLLPGMEGQGLEPLGRRLGRLLVAHRDLLQGEDSLTAQLLSRHGG